MVTESRARPEFMDSPCFSKEPEWHMMIGAPRELVREFKAYMEGIREAETERKADRQQEEDYDFIYWH